MAQASQSSGIVALQEQQIGGEVVLFVGPTSLVKSKSRPGQWWIVDGSSCSCPGFQYRGRCRHVVVAAEAQERDRQTAAPVVLADEPELALWRRAALGS